MHKKQISLILFLLVLAATAAQAGVIFSLAQPVGSGFAGDTITFVGSVTNNTGGDLYLLGLNFTLPGFTADAFDVTPFFVNTPFPMADGTSVGIPNAVALFSLSIPKATPVGNYIGIVEVQGLNIDGLEATLASLGFEVDVKKQPSGATPEPGALPLVAVALGGGAMLARRRRKSQ